MGKKAKIITFLLVLVLLFTMIPVMNIEAAGKVKINKTQTTIYVGASESLKVVGTKSKVTWTSSNKSVATVTNKGKVTALKAGKATITAKVSNKKFSCKVTVKNPSINAKTKTLYVGDTFALTLAGTKIKSAKSSNKSVATVSAKGKVTAKKIGKSTITLVGTNKKTYTCKVTVKEKPHVHSYKVETTDPTCVKKGIKRYTCACGNTYTEDINPTGHSYGEYTYNNDATYEKDGTETATCAKCGVTDTRTKSGSKLVVNRDKSHILKRFERINNSSIVILGYDSSKYSFSEADEILDDVRRGSVVLSQDYSSYSEFEARIRQLLNDTEDSRDKFITNEYNINGYTYHSIEYYDFLVATEDIFNEGNYIYVQVNDDTALVFEGRFYCEADEFICKALYISEAYTIEMFAESFIGDVVIESEYYYGPSYSFDIYEDISGGVSMGHPMPGQQAIVYGRCVETGWWLLDLGRSGSYPEVCVPGECVVKP